MENRKIKQKIFIDEFPLAPKDILSSFDVFGMSCLEFGAYCKILFVSWIQRPEQCFLKLDEHNICEMCNITQDEWAKVSQRVLKKFQLIYKDPDRTPYIYNEVLLEKYHAAVRELQKENSGKQLSAAAQMMNYPFDEFWKDYDKKVGNQERIFAKWIKLSDADREAIRADIPKRKEAQPKKQFRPNPSTYINGKLWRNEIIDYSNNTKTPARPTHKGSADYGSQQKTAV